MIKLGPALCLTTKYLLSIGMNERWRDGKQYIYTILGPAVTVHKQLEPAFTQLRRKVFRHAGQLSRRWLAACLHRGVVYLYIQLANTNLKQDTYNLLYLANTNLKQDTYNLLYLTNTNLKQDTYNLLYLDFFSVILCSCNIIIDLLIILLI